MTVLGGIVTQQRKTIVLGTNRLYSGQFQLRNIDAIVDSTRSNYRLEGDFTVSDGFALEMFLMHRRDVPAIVDGQEVERIWRTGLHRESELAYTIPLGGEFTFVIDNRVGEAGWKSVITRLVLRWDELVPVLNPSRFGCAHCEGIDLDPLWSNR